MVGTSSDEDGAAPIIYLPLPPSPPAPTEKATSPPLLCLKKTIGGLCQNPRENKYRTCEKHRRLARKAKRKQRIKRKATTEVLAIANPKKQSKQDGGVPPNLTEVLAITNPKKQSKQDGVVPPNVRCDSGDLNLIIEREHVQAYIKTQYDLLKSQQTMYAELERHKDAPLVREAYERANSLIIDKGKQMDEGLKRLVENYKLATLLKPTVNDFIVGVEQLIKEFCPEPKGETSGDKHKNLLKRLGEHLRSGKEKTDEENLIQTFAEMPDGEEVEEVEEVEEAQEEHSTLSFVGRAGKMLNRAFWMRSE